MSLFCIGFVQIRGARILAPENPVLQALLCRAQIGVRKDFFGYPASVRHGLERARGNGSLASVPELMNSPRSFGNDFIMKHTKDLPTGLYRPTTTVRQAPAYEY